MKSKDLLIEEVRINPHYSHLLYVEDTNVDSKPVIKKKSIYTKDYFSRINNDIVNIKQPNLLPPNCRYIENLPDGKLLIIEEEPAIRTFTFIMNLQNDINKLKKKNIEIENFIKIEPISNSKYDKYTFSLALPYVIFLLYIRNNNNLINSQVFVNPRQIIGLSDELYRVPFPNVSRDGTICIGDKNKIKNSKSLIMTVQQAILNFWSAPFNTDLSENYHIYNENKDTNILGNLLEWAYQTQINPMFVYHANWIPYGKNILKNIESFKNNYIHHNISTSNTLDYNKFSNFFTVQQKADVDKNKNVSDRLYYDICQSIYLNADFVLSVGDSFKLKNEKTAFIYSFAGFLDGGDISYIILDCEGKELVLKYTNECKRFLFNKIDKERKIQTFTMTNGTVIKAGDILKFIVGQKTVFKQVKFIRNSQLHNDVEIKLNNDYYLSNQIENCSIVDDNNMDLDYITLQKGHKYVVAPTHKGTNLLVCKNLEYSGLEVRRNDLLSLCFKNKNDIIYFEPTNDSQIFIKTSDVTKVDYETFIYGNLLLFPKNNQYGQLYLYKNKLLYDNDFYYLLEEYQHAQNKNILKDNSINIKGLYFDINYKVGDKVIEANWLNNPLNILNIKTIDEITYNDETNSVYFTLSDKNKNLSNVEYIKKNRINTHLVRKVTTKFANLQAGCKIIAKDKGISNFPKKDVNIIVAIIIDSAYEPLVLCSNGCTLWYSDVLSKFDIIETTDKRWSKLTHVPFDIQKINYQPGDIVTVGVNTDPFFIVCNSNSNKMWLIKAFNYFTSNYSYNYNTMAIRENVFNRIKFTGIPFPRISKTQQNTLPKVSGTIDMYGKITPDEDAFFNFIETEKIREEK